MKEWIIVYTNEIGIIANIIVSTHNYNDLKDVEHSFNKLHPNWKIISIKEKKGTEMEWTKEKPQLKKGYTLLCFSKTVFSGYVFSYHITEHLETGELLLMNNDEEDCDYSTFKYDYYMLVKFPEVEE